MKSQDKWTTRLYVKVEPQNHKIGLLRRVEGAKQCDAIIWDFSPVPGSKS
mgnify:CR=1 FL=1